MQVRITLPHSPASLYFERVYLKALFEEYARLPYAKREQIYFKDWIKDFNTAKNEGRSLKIYQSTSQKSFHVIPYKILQDRLLNSVYH